MLINGPPYSWPLFNKIYLGIPVCRRNAVLNCDKVGQSLLLSFPTKILKMVITREMFKIAWRHLWTTPNPDTDMMCQGFSPKTFKKFDKVSISPTFYACLFRTKDPRQAFLYLHFRFEPFLGAKILSQMRS